MMKKKSISSTGGVHSCRARVIGSVFSSYSISLLLMMIGWASQANRTFSIPSDIWITVLTYFYLSCTCSWGNVIIDFIPFTNFGNLRNPCHRNVIELFATKVQSEERKVIGLKLCLEHLIRNKRTWVVYNL